jgi:hypothetical protein
VDDRHPPLVGPEAESLYRTSVQRGGHTLDVEAVSMSWFVIILMGTFVMAAVCGGLYDAWLHRRHRTLAGWSDAERAHARIMSRYYAQYGPTQ